MILSGLEVITRQLVRNLQSATQQQPCGIDLTLRQVFNWTSAAILDLNNTKCLTVKISSLKFDSTRHTIILYSGAYLVDFNEIVQVPLNCMGSIFSRSSLWRSGVGITAGVVDALGVLIEMKNPHGVVLHRNVKLAKIVFEEVSETVGGYNGVYQSSTSSAGHH